MNEWTLPQILRWVMWSINLVQILYIRCMIVLPAMLKFFLKMGTLSAKEIVPLISFWTLPAVLKTHCHQIPPMDTTSMQWATTCFKLIWLGMRLVTSQCNPLIIRRFHPEHRNKLEIPDGVPKFPFLDTPSDCAPCMFHSYCWGWKKHNKVKVKT